MDKVDGHLKIENCDEVPASRDAFLGGQVTVYQSQDGRHRSGSDAVLLAASLPNNLQGPGYDFGCGSGAAGFCLAARCPQVSVTLVDTDETALALARRGVDDPQNACFADRLRMTNADLTAPESARVAAGLDRESANFVLCNPPFYAADHVRTSPNASKSYAHVLGAEGFLPWVKSAASILRPGGRLALILPAETLATILEALKGRFGGLLIKPLHPYLSKPASRLIIHGFKGRRTALTVLPPHALRRYDQAANTDAGYTDQTKAILREAASLQML